MKPRFEIGDNLAFVLIVLIISIAIIIAGVIDSKAQTVTLPTWVADSLIYEAKLSRQCSQVMTAQQEEIKALGAELVHTNTALKLSQSENKTLSGLVENAKESNVILTDQFNKDLKDERKKVKKWRRVAVIETVAVIVGLIILL